MGLIKSCLIIFTHLGDLVYRCQLLINNYK
jgi:hypothetical protein